MKSASAIRIAFAAVLGLAVIAPAAAQSYPTRAVRIIAPFPAGGSSDLGLKPAGNSPQQYAAFIKAEIDKVAKIAKAIGLQPE